MSDQRMSNFLRCCALAAVLLAGSMPTRAAAPDAIPLAMRVCEQGCKGPAVWTFMGKEGLGIWYGGATAKLVVERFDSGAITIRRKEIATRVSANIEGLYQGRIEGDVVTGTMSWWVGKAKPVVLPWTARIGGEAEQQVNARLLLNAIAGGYPPPGAPREAVAYGTDFARQVRGAAGTIAATGATPTATSASGPRLPLAFVECEMEGCTAPATWRFVGDTGATGLATWSTGATANLAVEQFDGATVLIQRSEIATPASRDIVALYRGRIVGDRIEGSMTWTAPGMMEAITKPWWARIGTPEEQAALAAQQLEALRARQKANDAAEIAQMMMWMGILGNMGGGSQPSSERRSSEQRERETRNMRCSLTRGANQRGAASSTAVADACQ